MSLLDRILIANRHDPRAFVPFLVAGHAVGHVHRDFAATLARWPRTFEISARAVRLHARFDQARTEERSAALAEVLALLAGEGTVPGWRDELYPVAPGPAVAPLLLMERAAVPWFGVTGYGIHVNGFVRGPDPGALRVWVARRAVDKPSFPGLLDQVVAGGQPAGISLAENLVKECAEEADIPAPLARTARPVGALRYRYQQGMRLRPDVLYDYDLELPEDFVPRNLDGEVSGFELWPVERLRACVRDTEAFKFNCALVVIDFLIRHGYISPEEPDYLELVHGLHHPPRRT